MRFAFLASSAAALAFLCGCSSSPPPPADAAWAVSLNSGSTGMCLLGPDTQSHTGLVNDQTKQMTVDDGMSNVTINCSVVQSGTSFAVNITAQDTTAQTGSNLTIQIPSISKGASQSSPAAGTLSYSSAATVDEEYASHDCNFYFSGAKQGVDAGQIWVTFDCPTITNGQSMSTCSVATSYAIFENCLTTM